MMLPPHGTQPHPKNGERSLSNNNSNNSNFESGNMMFEGEKKKGRKTPVAPLRTSYSQPQRALHLPHLI